MTRGELGGDLRCALEGRVIQSTCLRVRRIEVPKRTLRSVAARILAVPTSQLHVLRVQRVDFPQLCEGLSVREVATGLSFEVHPG